MNAQIITFIRVGVAALVGYLVGKLAGLGFHLSPAEQGTLVGAIMTVVTPLYLSLVTTLEKQWPWLGHLLIVRKPAKAAAK